MVSCELPPHVRLCADCAEPFETVPDVLICIGCYHDRLIDCVADADIAAFDRVVGNEFRPPAAYIRAKADHAAESAFVAAMEAAEEAEAERSEEMHFRAALEGMVNAEIAAGLPVAQFNARIAALRAEYHGEDHDDEEVALNNAAKPINDDDFAALFAELADADNN